MSLSNHEPVDVSTTNPKECRELKTEDLGLRRYRVALTVVVDQAGADESDAYNRAVTNLGLNHGETLFRSGHNHYSPVLHSASPVRWEGIMTKPSPEATHD